ncbi:MAG: LysE family transporter [Bacteroidales bacterium]|nr:LysE family transporter [Bacteroidales bacterium]
MHEIIKYSLSAFLLGLMAGISPGPILMLIISETLKHDKKEGIRIAMVPLITDLPIVIASVILISRLSSFNNVLGVISILGALFIIYLAYENIVYSGNRKAGKNSNLKPAVKGIIANFLSPYPYLFWMLIGAPSIIRAYELNPLASILYVIIFYLLLVGSKIIIAIAVHHSKNLINTSVFIYTIKILGIILIVFAGLMTIEGFNLLSLN